MVFLLASCGLVYFCCFVFCFVVLFLIRGFGFSFFSPKKAQTTGDSKNTKKARSQIVFLIFWGGLKMQMFAENSIKIVVPAFVEKWNTWPKTVKKVESRLGPRLRVKTWSMHLAQHNWTEFWPIFIVFFLFENLILPARRRSLKFNKGKREEIWTKFWLRKGHFWTKFWLYNTYIHTYIHI